MNAPRVIDDPLHRGEIEIIVAWVRSGLALSGEQDMPWAMRVLAKLRARWRDATPHPGDDTPRDYKVRQHEHRRESERTQRDRESFRGHGLAPGESMAGDARAAAALVETVAVRYRAQRAACLVAERLGSPAVICDEQVLTWRADGTQLLLWDPDRDTDEARYAELEAAHREKQAAEARERADDAAAGDGPAASPAKNRANKRRAPPRTAG